MRILLPLLALCALTSPAAADPEPARRVIQPGHEAQIASMIGDALERVGLSREVDIAVKPREIVVHLDELRVAGGPPVTLSIGEPRSSLDGEALGDALALRCTIACSADQLERGAALAREIGSRRDEIATQLWSPFATKAPEKRILPLGWLALFLLIVLGFALGGVVAREERRHLALLAGILLVGAALRFALAEHQLMGVRSWARHITWLWHLSSHEVPVLALFPDGMDVIQRSAATNLVLSFLLPFVVYVHARICLRDPWTALLATGFFAVNAAAIGFARSEVLFLSSMLFSSLGLIVFQRCLATGHRGAAIVYGLALLPILWLAFDARPLNVALIPVFLPAAWLHLREHRERWPRAAITLALAGAMTLWVVVHVYATGAVSPAPGASSEPPSLEHLWQVLLVLPHTLLVANNYFAPDLLPLWFSALALWGAWRMVRDDRAVFAYVGGWFALLYVGHGLIGAHTEVIAARYGLHTLIPVTFAAAWGAREGIRRIAALESRWARRLVIAVVAVACVGTSAIATTLLAPIEDDLNQEYRFLRDLQSRGIPEAGAAVVEDYDFNEPPRFLHLGRMTRGSGEEEVIRSVARPPRDWEGTVYLYHGLPCSWRRLDDAPISPKCAATLEEGRWERIDGQKIDGRLHDLSSARRSATGEVVLYRLIRR